MRILISGVHGFVGSNLVSYLKNRHEIYGLDIISPEKEGVIKTFSWDDLKNGLVPPVDAIIHLAGKAHDTKNQAAAEVYFKVNRDLTIDIYDYFLHSTTDDLKSAMEELGDEYTEEEVRLKNQLISEIGMLSNPAYRTLLTYRYIKGERLTAIAEIMKY